MKIKALVLAGASLLALASMPIGAARPIYGSWGYDASAMDVAVKPGDDFFGYVNGAWFKRTDVAPDRTFAGIDSVLNDRVNGAVRNIDAWYKAFDGQPGDKMYLPPEERVHVW